MPVTLKFQSTGAMPGTIDEIKMAGESLTVGRGEQNDLVLPDPDRVLSKRHCAIEDHNGNVVVVDFSTNGTFLNYGKLALGATPTPLNNGDILSVGPYEILVSITSVSTEDILAEPIPDGPVSHGDAFAAPTTQDLLDAPGDGGDFLDDLLGGRDAPVGPGMVDRAEPGDDGLLPPLGEDDGLLPPLPEGVQGASTASHSPSAQDHFPTPQAAQTSTAIPDDWDDLLEPTPAPGAPDPFATPTPAAPPAQPTVIPEDNLSSVPTDAPESVPPVPAPAPIAAPDPSPAPAASTAPGETASGRAFLDALGAEDISVSDADLPETMTRMGKVLRAMIEGMREILMTRSSIKSEFRIEQTMIKAGSNNPLKFSISPEQAIEAMVKPKAKGYLSAEDATAEALKDIKAHEVAVITGMEAALKGILAKLDPAVLEEKISVSSGLGSVLKSKKARYWEIYETMYAEISDQAENDFQELFAKEFARAYQQQLDKLK
ncbi:MAG: type VI secretion system-associated FHA domain protein TagH [Pseudomonadota bacterium]